MAGPGQARFYSSTFVQTSLASGISAGALTFNVGTTTGAPGTPFVVSVDQNTATEELMLVTNVSGLTYTVTRGVGGTAAQSHSNGAPVVHVMYAQDLTDASAHIGAFDNVHGLAVNSLVVGTTDTQTLTNKTLATPIINNPTISTPTITGTATMGSVAASGTVSGSEFIPVGLTGAQNASAYVGATVSGAPVTGSFIVGNYVIDRTGLLWICTAAGSPGTWISLANTSAAQTLTNKTLTSPVISGSATGTGSVTLSNFIVANEFIANGVTGATAASTYAGGTASGAPSTGAHSVGDFIVDQTGLIWVCTVTGTPGTWISLVNVSGTQTLSNKSLSAPASAGLTGATAASRWVGATASGAPASGTFVVGDFVIDQTGNVWVCTTGGSPGTWQPVGGARGIMAAPVTTSSAGTATSTTTETFDAVLGTYQFNAVTGRRYKVVLEGLQGSATAGDVYKILIRNSGSASSPTTGSTVNATSQWVCTSTGGTGQASIPVEGNFLAGSTSVNTIEMSATRLSGTGSFTPVGARSMYVEDIGNV